MLPNPSSRLTLYGLLATTTSLAAPLPEATWTLASFQYRCIAPNIVESHDQAWTEWRVSSICAPGTCCAQSATTGPLCVAEACPNANQDREQALLRQNQADASRKKAEQEMEEAAERARRAGQADRQKTAMEAKAEAMWKTVDEEAEATRDEALANIHAHV